MQVMAQSLDILLKNALSSCKMKGVSFLNRCIDSTTCGRELGCTSSDFFMLFQQRSTDLKSPLSKASSNTLATFAGSTGSAALPFGSTSVGYSSSAHSSSTTFTFLLCILAVF